MHHVDPSGVYQHRVGMDTTLVSSYVLVLHSCITADKKCIKALCCLKGLNIIVLFMRALGKTETYRECQLRNIASTFTLFNVHEIHLI